jgi:hypothetical protein
MSLFITQRQQASSSFSALMSVEEALTIFLSPIDLDFKEDLLQKSKLTDVKHFLLVAKCFNLYPCMFFPYCF